MCLFALGQAGGVQQVFANGARTLVVQFAIRHDRQPSARTLLKFRRLLENHKLGDQLAVQPMDMRAGAERLLASVVTVFSAAQAHHGYLFVNARHTRIKLPVHDGFGVWVPLGG